MTLNTNFFSTCDKVNVENVTLGNDDTCKNVGISNILIEMHDGVIRTICGVRHVS